ncbi:MAG: RdgB/HAM1 family non-canonical purine NTP pyrophosphatase [Clostridia bacterium]|nr:RdgB/HAM1 family non-canonical purine NTP pyrophosphatase [Clostridia bacterium]
MKVVLASRNKKKIRELETLLSTLTSQNIEVLSLDDIGYTDEIVEDGSSFTENALIKAAVPASLGYIGIADDSGLMVDALNGAPGIYSARYSGADATDSANNEKLLTEMEAVTDDKRGGAFVSAIACVLPAGMEADIPDGVRVLTREGLTAFTITGECRGTILRKARGDAGFGYDPLFYVPSKSRTFAELSAEEKNEISHRGIAMRSFCAAFTRVFADKF